MRNKIILTIGRTFGSGGRQIGEKLANALDISFYDKNLIAMAAEQSGLDQEILESADEKILSRYMDPYAIAGGFSANTNNRLFEVESKIIQEIAAKESCVIVGRLADYVLQDNPNCIKVFIFTSYENRIKRIMELHNLKEAEAKKLIREMDRIRRNYYAYFTDQIWGSTDNKHIMIDSGLLGIDGTVQLLVDLTKQL